MTKLNADLIVSEFLNKLEITAVEKSKQFCSETNYAFAYGYSRSSLDTILSTLNLTQKQLKQLQSVSI